MTGVQTCALPILQAQRPCASSEYLILEIQKDPALALRILEAEQSSRKGFGEEILSETPNSPSQTLRVITIPVVVHVLYHDLNEKISEQQVLSQIEILNQEFQPLILQLHQTLMFHHLLHSKC